MEYLKIKQANLIMEHKRKMEFDIEFNIGILRQRIPKATRSSNHVHTPAQENKQIESRNEHVFNKFTKDGCELYIVSLYVIEMILRVYYVKCCCMRAWRTAFPNRLLPAGAWWNCFYGSIRSAGSSMYSFHLLKKLYNTAAAIIIVNMVSGFVRSVGTRHGNIHMPNKRSIVVLLRIWTTLYLPSGHVCGASSGVINKQSI